MLSGHHKPIDVIKELENHFDVMSITVDGISIWNFLKHSVFGELENQYYNLQTNKPNKKIVAAIYNRFWKSKNIQNKQYMLFTDQNEFRNIDDNSQKTLMPSDKLAHNIIQKMNEEMVVVLNPLNQKHHEKYYFNAISSHYFSARLSENKNIKNESILLNIENYIGFQINYKLITNRFFSIYKKAKKYFQLNDIKTIYINCYYSIFHQAIILAAKENNIKIIEIQHGVISPNQLYYNLTNKTDKKFLPDYLLAHNTYIKEIVSNHYMHKSNVITFGNYYLEYMETKKIKLKNIEDFNQKYQKIILISDQKSINSELNDMIKKVSSMYPQYGFIFALRSENERDQIKENILITSRDIYSLLQYANLHISVYSTFILETLFSGIPNILFNARSLSRDYYQKILKSSNGVIYADSIKEIQDCIDEWPFDEKNIIKKQYNYLFHSNNKDALNKFVNNVIES